MPAPATPPIGRVDLHRRDTEIAVAAFRTIFILIVVFSPQFARVSGTAGRLLFVATVTAAIYNVVLFLLHTEGLPFPRAAIVAVDTVLISLWIYFAGPGGDRYFPMYFAVVVVAGLWLRRVGVGAVALFACVLYVWAISYSPMPEGIARPSLSVVGLQLLFLLLAAGLVSIGSEVQQRERGELLLARARLEEHWQRVREAQYVDRFMRPPRLPSTPGLDVAVKFRPATAGASGDYYDVIRLGERRWGFVVADVRAKTEPALAYLPVVRSTFRVTARDNAASPAALLNRMNREVASQIAEYGEVLEDVFVGVCYAILDLDQGVMVYGNAGMEPGVLGPASSPHLISLSSHGLVLGVSADATYEEESWAIHSGDTLVFFSDGVTEATDSEGRLLGRERLLDWIAAGLSEGSAEAMAREVFDAVIDYGSARSRRDDSTLLVIRITAPDVGPRPEPSAV
ncbi:MAG: PP2C family protein-serine/threonine phosphatase [Armatimonadota bacterium]